MARTVEQWLQALRGAPSEELLREALGGQRAGLGLVVAAAAKQIAARHMTAALPELVDVFDRLSAPPSGGAARPGGAGAFDRLSAPPSGGAARPGGAGAFDRLGDAKRDPGCRGKIAIARALHELDHWEDRVFVRGLTIVQHESGEDTAAELRGICGLAHAHFARPDALDVLAGLLADPQRTPRVAAAQGIADLGRPDGTALLRLRLLVDEREPEVLAACFESLLSLAREASAEFATGLLGAHDDRAEAAALALGGARISTAVAPLIAWCDACTPEQRHRVGYLALALVRADAATALLLAVVRGGGQRDARAAAKALATFKDDPSVAVALREAVQAVDDRALRTELEALLPTSQSR